MRGRATAPLNDGSCRRSAWGWAFRIWDGTNLTPSLSSRARFLRNHL